MLTNFPSVQRGDVGEDLTETDEGRGMHMNMEHVCTLVETCIIFKHVSDGWEPRWRRAPRVGRCSGGPIGRRRAFRGRAALPSRSRIGYGGWQDVPAAALHDDIEAMAFNVG